MARASFLYGPSLPADRNPLTANLSSSAGLLVATSDSCSAVPMLRSCKHCEPLPTRTKLLVVLGVIYVCYLAALSIQGNLSGALLKR